MRLYNIYGNLQYKNVSKYRIKWDKPSLSEIQFKTKQFLKPFWFNHVIFEEFPVYGSLLRVDILNATLNLAIEINGPQHDSFHYFHNNSPSKYLQGIKNDIKKEEWLRKNNFKLLEINSDEIPLLSIDFFKSKFNVVL